MTLSRNLPASITCSSLVNCFLFIFSGRVRYQDASLLDTDLIDCDLEPFRSRRGEVVFREGSIIGETFSPRRSARLVFLRVRCVGSSLRAFDLDDSANLNRSSVEKYCEDG